MTEETIVAVFDTAAHADAAVRDLQAAHVPPDAISRQPSTADGSTTTTTTPRGTGFWAGLFGGEPDHDTAVYERSAAGGSHVVTVRTPDTHVASVIGILEHQHPIDIDERAAGYGLGAPGTASTKQGAVTTGIVGAHAGTAADDEERLQLAEEQVQVGKRLVNRGTTRIRRFVVQTPVEENVTLHSEHVSVDRHPAPSDANLRDAAFSEKTIEATETDEEAVVSKTSRVREEIVLRKDVSDRVETIHDTVRREDVEVIKDGNAGADFTQTRTVPPLRR